MIRVFPFIILLCLAPQRSFSQSATPSPETKLIQQFLSESVLIVKGGGNKVKRKKMISPAYLKKHNALNKKIHMLRLVDFMIYDQLKQNNGRQSIRAYVWGPNKKWVSELWFTVIKENGKNYIKPWHDISAPKGSFYPWGLWVSGVSILHSKLKPGGQVVLKPSKKKKPVKPQPITKRKGTANAAMRKIVHGLSGKTMRTKMKKAGYQLVLSKAVELNAQSKFYEYKGFQSNKVASIFVVCENTQGELRAGVNGSATALVKFKKELITEGMDQCVYFHKQQMNTKRYSFSLKFSYSKPTKAHIVIYEKE